MVENELWKGFPEELKAWLASEEPKPGADSIGEMVRETKSWIETGAIKVERENNRYFALIESKYPVCVNRIEWSWIQNHVCGDVLPVEVSDTGISAEKKEAKLRDWRITIDEWLRSYGVRSTDEIILIGDGGNATFRMPVAVLLDCYPLLFSLPQHTYVLPSDAEWCLNYTMEGQLFLGKAIDALRHGVVEGSYSGLDGCSDPANPE